MNDENKPFDKFFQVLSNLLQILGGIAGILGLAVAILALGNPQIREPLIKVVTGSELATQEPSSITIGNEVNNELDIATATDSRSLSSPTPMLHSTMLPLTELLPLFADNFATDEGKWSFPRSDNFEYRNGGLILRCASGEGGCAGNYDSVRMPNNSIAYARPHQVFDNFVLEVDGQRLQGVIGGTYGILFRYQDLENYYEFTVENARRFLVGKMINGTYVKLNSDQEYADTINLLEEINHIRIEANNDSMQFFINGNHIYSLQDSSHKSGDIVLFMKFPYVQAGNEELEVAFYDIAVYKHP